MKDSKMFKIFCSAAFNRQEANVHGFYTNDNKNKFSGEKEENTCYK